MNWIKDTIDNWFKEYTVPYNTCPARHRLETFSNEDFKKKYENDTKKIEEHFNNLTKCAFVIYNNTRRILLKNPAKKYDFVFLDDQYWYNFNELIDRLLHTEYKEDEERDYTSREYITVSVSSAQDVLNYFKIDYDFNSYAKQRDYYLEDGNSDRFCFYGDGWDTNANGCYHDSELFEKIDKHLREEFKYEVSPYKKYNPDFDQYKESVRITDFRKMLDVLSFEQIKSVLTERYWDSNTTLASQQKIDTSKIDFLKNMDKNTMSNVLDLILDSTGKRSFVFGAGILYNI